jgi:chromosome partitioning protein
MRGKVLVSATIKGGAGKSTLIACLATYWHTHGHSVALIDADPNQTLTRWHGKGNALSELVLRTEVDEFAIVGLVDELASNHDLVLIDCAGFGNQAMVFAVGAADLVLIPVMTDEANIFEAIRTRKVVESASALTKREIMARTVLSRVKRTTVARHARAQLEALNAQPLNAAIMDRAVFQEATFHGSSPVVLAPRSAAAEDVEALAKELEQLPWWLDRVFAF